MDSFLARVAQDLYARYGTDLSRIAVIFPNKRASLFFNSYLAQCTDKPMWSCAYLSISELFQRFSPLKKGDSIRLVGELYGIYKEITKSKESMDSFYFWGELLISDFDDVDKNLVDAEQLFANLSDLKNLYPEMDFLSDEEREAIQQFFQHIDLDHQTELKERFISLWNVLGDIYHQYTAHLREQGIAYEGMLYRSVIDELDLERLPYDKYVFVGFNVLNKVEQRLFEQLKEQEMALFYWDYDEAYLNHPHHEAGEFIQRNLRLFPSALSSEGFSHLHSPKKITYIASPTENAQARYLPTWLKETKANREADKAVVLCNEALLQPIIHAIPSEVEHCNVTMGFPLLQTPAYSFIEAVLKLMESYQPDKEQYIQEAVLACLRHSYTLKMSDEAQSLERKIVEQNRLFPTQKELQLDAWTKQLFVSPGNAIERCEYLMQLVQQVAMSQLTNDELIYHQLYQEALFKTFTTLNRLKALMEDHLLEIQPKTFQLLLRRVLAGTSIPFHGEPVVGMQVMGVLETRNLDFKHLLLLSVNEGMLPQSTNDASYIPYNLRKAFGMTTVEHKNAVYAYYFYRLIQRAETVTILYNTATEGVNPKGMSRFLLQLLVDLPYEVERKHLAFNQAIEEVKPIVIEKTEGILQDMRKRYEVDYFNASERACFSPSALNKYMDCSLAFYYRYVAGIRPNDVPSAEIDPPMFGTLFHKAAELTYAYLTEAGKLIKASDMAQLLKDKIRIDALVDSAFKEEYFKVNPKVKVEYNGMQLISFKAIVFYLRRLLQVDQRYAPFTYEDSELRVSEPITIKVPWGEMQTSYGGYIDRLDSKGDTLRIVDYKTGGIDESTKDLAALFTPGDKRAHYKFQTFAYASILQQRMERGEEPIRKIAPALLYIHRAIGEEYNPIVSLGERKTKQLVTDYAEIHADFKDSLKELIEEVFNPELPFEQSESAKPCKYCDFKTICKRKGQE